MKGIGKSILALGLTVAMAGASHAQDLDPTGVWVAEKNSDYSVSWCDADSRQLCVKLVALRGNMRKKHNLEYLNATMRGENALHVKLCAYIVICDEYDMTRVE